MGFLYDAATTFMTDYRGIFVTVFVLPISLVYDVLFRVRSLVVMALYSAPEQHAKRVEGIQRQILAWDAKQKANPGETPTKLCTSRGGWLSISPSMRTYKKHATTIDVDLFDVLELNEAEQWVHVEPQVSMGQLSHFLVAKGLTIPILPELDDLTVGGLLMGVGIEGSSHIYGLFNDSVVEAEMVLSTGEVKVCSKAQNRDLFDALPWSYGTFGFLASCKIKVVPCKPFVRMQYIPCRTQEESTRVFTHYSTMESPPDFVEALAYSKDTFVVMPAWYCDAEDVDPAKKNDIGRWYKPWFFKHVQSFLDGDGDGDGGPGGADGEPATEYIPYRPFVHRYSSGIFWELEEIIPFGNHPLFRYLLGWATPPSIGFLKATQTAAIRHLYETQHVIQDMLVPITELGRSLDVFDEHYGIYPLWVCPYRAYAYDDAKAGVPHRSFLRRPLSLQEGKDFEMYVDLGAYGVPRACKAKLPFDIVQTSRKVEDFVFKVHGHQMLYADSYQTEEEFRAMFDHKHLDAVKDKYDPAGAFPSVYSKVCKKGLALWGNTTKTKTT